MIAHALLLLLRSSRRTTGRTMLVLSVALVLLAVAAIRPWAELTPMAAERAASGIALTGYLVALLGVTVELTSLVMEDRSDGRARDLRMAGLGLVSRTAAALLAGTGLWLITVVPMSVMGFVLQPQADLRHWWLHGGVGATLGFVVAACASVGAAVAMPRGGAIAVAIAFPVLAWVVLLSALLGGLAGPTLLGVAPMFAAGACALLLGTLAVASRGIEERTS